jgi:hypothetical protein
MPNIGGMSAYVGALMGAICGTRGMGAPLGWYIAAMGTMGGFGAPMGDDIGSYTVSTPPMWLMKMMHRMEQPMDNMRGETLYYS